MPATLGLHTARNLVPDAHKSTHAAGALGERSRRRSGWMALAQRGDGIAYRALLDDLSPVVVRFLGRRLHDREDVADACQDTFLAVHRARHTYQPRRPIEPWIFAIARNVAHDYMRRHLRRSRYEILTDATPEATPEVERDPGRRLDSMLGSLPNRQREAVQLLKVQGLTVAEAAARAGTTPTALRIRAHRAYVALRAAFRK